MNDIDDLIEHLSEDAAPVRVQRDFDGRLGLGLIAAATIAAIALKFGIRPDLVDLTGGGRYLPIGLMALLAVASGYHAIRLARPQVGAPAPGLGWLVAALAILPLGAAIAIVAEPHRASELAVRPGLRCLEFGLLAGLAAIAFLAAWLRRGASVVPTQAAWLAGLCAGAIGSLGVSLECGFPSLLHLDVWHVAVIPAMAVTARLALPRLVRW
jgi:hypothetical protein